MERMGQALFYVRVQTGTVTCFKGTACRESLTSSSVTRNGQKMAKQPFAVEKDQPPHHPQDARRVTEHRPLVQDTR